MSEMRQRSAASKEVIVTPEEIARQKERQKQWMAKENKDLEEYHAKVKKQNQESSDRALKIVISVWVIIVFVIIYHVYNTITTGIAFNANSNSDEI
mmetsp:Transcript_15573/g.21883  ORF Transcript_15573/g.21883 Transcript_15573/m.21883 type:complete len:96 (+) Transcript_15573:78-365(+)|eukprot:CAMPEP_0175088712 /NCGR_PEP_ID=MMETSP0086_2-20121207/394_1 /TAXON_ID=136419 /ORGANISM="Unknown Unknown, Strain D1" /LENGTH=95 /DNA_ID=CAMNT_0016361163 /DNA_START=57 /DNA_END=344 /DNA_ORIENTATION=-